MSPVTSESVFQPRPTSAGPWLSLAQVRQAQAELAAAPRIRRIDRYTSRDTWHEVASVLTGHYFPIGVQKENVAMDWVTQLYRYALVFYPLHYRLPGTYRPSWSRGALLSWLRRSIGPITRQWYAGVLSLEEPPVITTAVQNASERLQIVNGDAWLSEACEFLDDHSQAATRRGDLARLIYLPIAYAHRDADWQKLTRFDAKPHQRRVLRATGQGSVGYLRRGREIILVADRQAAERLNDVDWVDLREGWLDVWDYRIRWTADPSGQRAGGVQIELRPEVIRHLEADAKSLLHEAGQPHYRLHRLNRRLAGFVETHRYASGAGRQLFEIDAKVKHWVRQTLSANDPDAKHQVFTLHTRLVRRLVLPVANPFLDPHRLAVPAWQAMFNPYR